MDEPMTALPRRPLEELVREKIAQWRADADDAKARGYLETWNARHADATDLDLALAALLRAADTEPARVVELEDTAAVEAATGRPRRLDQAVEGPYAGSNPASRTTVPPVSARLRELAQTFRAEVRDKLAVVFDGCNGTRLQRETSRQQCEDFLVELFSKSSVISPSPHPWRRQRSSE